MTRRRWPRRVYGVGDEPDPRFTLANERTFLAWLRTALALMAGGIAIHAIGTQPNSLRTTLAIALLTTGITCSLSALCHWMTTERALRTGQPLPTPWLAAILSTGLAVIATLAAVLVLS